MWKLLKIELFKIFRRPRTYIAFIAIAAIVLLIQLAFYVDGKVYLDFLLGPLRDSFEVEGKVLNGYLVCFVILQMLIVHVPLLIALVAGDMIAGEANAGTLRLLASKPISRFQFMICKFLASVIYTLLLLCFLAILALGVSVLIFGTGDLMIAKSVMIIILDGSDVLWRYIAALGFAALSMITVASLAFLFSVFGENSIGPIVGTMCVIIVFTILTTLEIPFFNAMKPFLFTNHMLNWKGFFEDPVDYREVLKSALILSLHIVFFVSLAIVAFQKKDILS